MSKKPQIRVSVVVVFLCSPALAAAQDVSPAPAGTRPLGGPVMWVLLGEMFPNQLRGAALAVSGATNWVVNFAVTVTFLPLLDAVGLAGAYGLYAMGAMLSLPFVWAAVRETKGKTLEQM
jgi:Sugar (and other) transporter